MDEPMMMRDGSRRRGTARRGSGPPPPGVRAPRRSDPYSRDSRPRHTDSYTPAAPAAPAPQPRYEEPAPVASGMAYPPPEFSIRGSSGPTWVIVSNLVVGTSIEDVRLTFGSFGKVEEVKQRPSPSANHPTVSFEVAFDRRQDAQTAVDKFNGALADGRILSVSIKKVEGARDSYSQFNGATAQAVAQRPAKAQNLIQAPAPIPYTPNPAPAAAAAIPTAPASHRSRARAAELVEPRARKGNAPANKNGSASNNALPPKAGAGTTVVPLAQRIPLPLANRLLTPAQAKKVQAEEAAKKAKNEEKARALAATGKTTVLGKRLGGLPLAQRLLEQAGTPKSDGSAIKVAAEKKKRKRDAVRAKKAAKASAGTAAAGMDIDG